MQKRFTKLAILLLLVGLALLFHHYNLESYLTLESIKARQNNFLAYYELHPIATLSGFFGIYIFMTSLSLPGAVILTLLSGALFGFTKGLVLVSFASSIGATIAFLIARFLLRDLIERRYNKTYSRINKGIDNDGAYYLLFLRLVPIFPFFLVNILMALTSLRTLTFYLISQLGMLPGTAVYVLAGKELGEVETLSDIVDWDVLLAFTLLGLVPLVIRKLLLIFRKPTSIH